MLLETGREIFHPSIHPYTSKIEARLAPAWMDGKEKIGENKLKCIVFFFFFFSNYNTQHLAGLLGSPLIPSWN